MKTPYLDNEIETYKIHKKQGYLTSDGEKYLAEFKAIKQALIIADVGWRSEQLPDFDVQEINEILQDCKEKKEDLQALICRIWNKGYMTAVADEREG